MAAGSRFSWRVIASVVAFGLLVAVAVVLPESDASAAAAPALYVSSRADRTGAQPLAGRTVTGNLYIFVARSTAASDTSGITRVEFKVDGVAVSVETLAPFDLAGGAPYVLPAGSHRIDARITPAIGLPWSVSASFAVAAPAPATTSTTVAPAPVAVASRLPRFSASSFWYQAVPANAPLHPSSATLVANFDRQWRQYYANVGINTTTYSPPVFVASATTPLRLVRLWDCQGKGYLDPALSAQLAAVPVPADAAPSAGTDSEMVISQPSTNSIWELWRARKAADGIWEACWGGKLANVSASQGLFAVPFGTTATGLSLTGGLIAPEELAAGRIDHALAVSLVELRSKVFSWPAGRTDGTVDAVSAIMEGQRFRLDPTIDVNALPITGTAKVVAKALQTYGMVVRDRAGAVSLYAENTSAEGRGDQYPSLFAGVPNYKVLAGIPWTRLQALPAGYGKP